jgi:hypothetical protein
VTRTLLLIPLLVLASCAPAPQPAAERDAPVPVEQVFTGNDLTVTMTINDAEPAIVDDIDLVFAVTGPATLVVSAPDWSAAIPEELTLERVQRLTPAPAEPATLAAWRLTLTALAPGEYELRPLTFEAVDPEAEAGAGAVATEPVAISVESILGEADAQLADLKDPLDPPADRTAIALIAAAGAVALAALIAGAVMLARRPKHEFKEPPIPAHQRARLELEALLATDLIERRAWKPFFTELTGLLRRYIEARFTIHAPAQTTDEFLRDPATRDALTAEQNARLASLLASADVIKFAEAAADERTARAAAGDVARFIDETAPVEEPARQPAEEDAAP